MTVPTVRPSRKCWIDAVTIAFFVVRGPYATGQGNVIDERRFLSRYARAMDAPAPASLDRKGVASAALVMANGARGFVRLPLTLMALVAIAIIVTTVTGTRPELLP